MSDNSLIQILSSKAVCGVVGGGYGLLSRGRFPQVVRVETTNACNARCTICPHRTMQRPICTMDEATFRRIIDECAKEHCHEVHLHNFGEPLLDKNLESRVRYAKQAGIEKVKIFSNGALLDAERAKGLIEAGLDEIKVSMDGATRAEFERIRAPLKYDVVVENIRRLAAYRNEAGSRMRIKFACVSTSDKEATIQSLEKIVDRFSFGKIHNWNGEESGSPRSGIRKPCSRLWRTFTILADARVALCCLDYDGRIILGRIDETHSIRSIFNSEAYNRLRILHRTARQDEISLCRNCSKAFLSNDAGRKAA